VLLNLLANAVKFTPTGGRVELHVTCAAPPGNPVQVKFTVRDNGIGMDEAARTRVFERFAQADSSTTRRYGGSGLGLSISARLVELMGGRLELESAPGRGSVFHFTIPLAPGLRSPGGESAHSPALLNLNLKVLVAEDNAINSRIILTQLQHLGCSPTHVTDGVEVLTRLEQGLRPDVILMDCHMPKLDGWETTRRIRAWATEPPGVRWDASVLPIIALTAATQPEERARCLESGMDGFIAKPVRLADLQDALQVHARD
jgi:CheY-like chemotaxis protein